MAFSRVELGVHWTTDVVASMVFVAAWLLLLWATFVDCLRHIPSTDGTFSG
jgi:membrane-associated phospholipid phosphatase